MTTSDPIKYIYNACDPYRPATESQYLDCSGSRGGSALTFEFQRRLQLANDHLSFLFAGHIGCGKSSELKELERLLTELPAPGQSRYFPVRIDVSDYVDDYDFETADLVLAIVSELAAALRREPWEIELADSYFSTRFAEIWRFLLSDVELTEGEIPLWAAKVKITRLKRDPDARQKVRENLAPKMSTMLAEINTVFQTARVELRKKAEELGEPSIADLVFMIDNLEKIRRVGNKPEGLESQRELFLDRYTQLTGMRAHFIWTVPLRLARSQDGPQLEQRYDAAPFVLPMVKVQHRDTQQPFSAGIECLKTLLQQRLPEEFSLSQTFTQDVLDFLLKYSGGHVRNLLVFVQNACTYATRLPITLKDAERAVQQSARTYSTAIPEKHWDLLANLQCCLDQSIPGGDADYLAMLENLSVMEYVNGGDHDPFAEAEPWYAVNPIVRELKKFKAALAKQSRPVT